MPEEPPEIRSFTIEINGVIYHRIEDVPEHYRHLFRDADGNGVPDIIDEARKTAGDAPVTVETRIRLGEGRDGRELERRGLQALLRSGKPLRALRCSSCDYDLRATPTDQNCPECGQPVAASVAKLFEDVPLSRRRASTGSFFSVTPGCLIWGLVGVVVMIVLRRCM